MPNSKSAEKRVRQNENRQAENKARRSKVKTAEKKLQEKIAAKDAAGAQEQLGKVAAQYDKAAKVGIIHPNKADRKKSRLSKAVNALTQG